MSIFKFDRQPLSTAAQIPFQPIQHVAVYFSWQSTTRPPYNTFQKASFYTCHRKRPRPFFSEIRPACTLAEASGFINRDLLVETEADCIVTGEWRLPILRTRPLASVLPAETARHHGIQTTPRMPCDDSEKLPWIPKWQGLCFKPGRQAVPAKLLRKTQGTHRRHRTRFDPHLSGFRAHPKHRISAHGKGPSPWLHL